MLASLVSSCLPAQSLELNFFMIVEGTAVGKLKNIETIKINGDDDSSSSETLWPVFSLSEFARPAGWLFYSILANIQKLHLLDPKGALHGYDWQQEVS